MIEYLAGREQPMTIRLAGRESSTSNGDDRKVSLGSIPDFTYQGEGYRLDGVVPGSPAAQSGLAKSDIIVAINGVTIHGIRDISKLLKTLKPGQTINIRYLRDGKESETTAALTAK